MALPDNTHHIHSDGYTSEHGEPDSHRRLVECGDEIEQIDGVTAVYHNDGWLEVTYDESVVLDAVGTVVDEWACRVTAHGDGWCEIEPDC
jgi:hypothetical protein